MTANPVIPFFLPVGSHRLPCLIEVISYRRVPPFLGPAHLCPSDLDYYGYEETEWEILKPSGFYSPWLASQVTNARDIERAISEAAHANRDE